MACGPAAAASCPLALDVHLLEPFAELHDAHHLLLLCPRQHPTPASPAARALVQMAYRVGRHRTAASSTILPRGRLRAQRRPPTLLPSCHPIAASSASLLAAAARPLVEMAATTSRPRRCPMPASPAAAACHYGWQGRRRRRCRMRWMPDLARRWPSGGGGREGMRVREVLVLGEK